MQVTKRRTMGSPLPVAACALLLAASTVTEATAAPRAVASIVPIHSLVAGVMAGVGEPILLLKGGSSPHAYALKPSDARRLENADIVFRVGDDLETFLVRPLASLPRRARIVTLSEVPGLTLHDIRSGGVWSEQDHDGDRGEEHHAHGESGGVRSERDHDGDRGEEHHAHGESGGVRSERDHDGDRGEEHHAHGEHDLHIWLDPINAQAMVDAIVRALSDIDTANAPRYRANGAALHRRLEALDETLMRALAPLRQRPYIVFHDAYRYFETRYGLTPAGSVTLGPERAPGAATLTALRRAIVEAGAVCVFAEPQFEPAILRMLVADTGARSGVLDPLGAGLEAGADAYFALLSGLAASLRQCLEPAGPTPSEPLE